MLMMSEQFGKRNAEVYISDSRRYFEDLFLQ